MTPASRKRALLGVLLVVMVYVWWDGLKTMYPATSSYVTLAPLEGKDVLPSERANDVPYQEPKTNPFYRPTQDTSRRADQRQAQPPTQAVAPLHLNHRLIGVLKRDKQSQAVVADDNRTDVVSIGDSVGIWVLVSISENHAVFRHDKERDTLWLYRQAN